VSDGKVKVFEGFGKRWRLWEEGAGDPFSFSSDVLRGLGTFPGVR
jgi:hypothetical protein